MRNFAVVAALFAACLFAACEQPKDDETAKDPAEAPAVVVEEEVMEETVVLPPTVSEDAPSEPHMGEPPSPNQPQPVYPDGGRETLLRVPQWDFNWQNTYRLAEPKLMPKGTRLEGLAYYDNSTNNLANPDPSQTIRWGDQTWEEMHVGWFNYFTEARPAGGR